MLKDKLVISVISNMANILYLNLTVWSSVSRKGNQIWLNKNPKDIFLIVCLEWTLIAHFYIDAQNACDCILCVSIYTNEPKWYCQ